ncbi:MAG: hypothetical protein CMJ31_09485 [Phycisphaerae bacterium]|nr:hypothetical protein [Phycisphaerae bacterium]
MRRAPDWASWGSPDRLPAGAPTGGRGFPTMRAVPDGAIRTDTNGRRIMKIAFSTVACPQWTLEQTAQLGASLGYSGIELRTFGADSVELASDPALTAGAKVRDILEDAGIDPAGLATSVRFDAPIWPPIIGRVFGDVERPVRETRSFVHLAASIECPYVRVFGFELPAGEGRSAGMRRLVERLELASRTARHTGVKLLVENGGAFPLARDLAELIDRVGSPLVEACYTPAVAEAHDEDPVEGVDRLAGRLAVVRLKDYIEGRPVALGDGENEVAGVVRRLGASGYSGWACVEYDRMWFPDLEEPERPLKVSIDRVYEWMGRELSDIERRKFARA